MSPRTQSGFAYIAAIVFLVVIAGISVALLRLTDTQQQTVNQAVLGARASLAARAGIEWALQNLNGRCDGASDVTPRTTAARSQTSQLTDFVQDSGFRVSVTCSFRSFREGEAPDADGTPKPVTKRIYRVEAVACNGPGNCLDNAGVAAPDYVERKRVATVCKTDADGFCSEDY